MELFVLFVWFAVLAAVIVFAGMGLTHCADGIASRTGLGRTLAGLILLAAATSLPELAVDCSLVFLDTPAVDAAVGALVGSSLFNLLILGVLDFCHRHSMKVFSPAGEEHILSAVTSIITTGLVVVFVVLGVHGYGLSFWALGLGPVLVLVVYFVSLRLVFLDQQVRKRTVDSEDESDMSLSISIIGYALCTVVIFVAANYLAPTAVEIAEKTGLGETFIGNTLVALTTSLPELVTTAAAIRIGAFNMAIGNVVGSNNFNMAILFPVDCFYRGGALLQEVVITHAIVGGFVILITSVLVMSLIYQGKRKYRLIEPNASVVVILAIIALFLIYQLRGLS